MGGVVPGTGATGRKALRHIAIVGGGASGVLMAVHLLGHGAPGLRVTLVERGPMLGCGIAYGTTHPDHLLNTRVAQMSAFPDAPDHFRDWLERQGRPAGAQCFVDRGTYGRYLSHLLEPWRKGSGAQRLRCVQASCTSLRETAGGVVLHLADSSSVIADAVVLATGHAVPAEPEPPLRGGWDFTLPADPDATVAIIGTGLSMVDHAVTLLGAGHRGPILCMSRRGLVPQRHAATQPLALGRQDIPLGAPVSAVLRWLRGQVHLAQSRGGTWRDAVDGIRPHVAAIWRAWPRDERARFLRHAAAWWEVHRHRMPPVSADRIAAAQASGQLTVLRGRFAGAHQQDDGRIGLDMVPARAGHSVTLQVDHVIDCRGIRRDAVQDATPVVRDLLGRGAARLDALALGLDTDAEARVVDRNGRASARVFAVGPAARGALWEITAIPDIREQTFRLATGALSVGAVGTGLRAPAPGVS